MNYNLQDILQKISSSYEFPAQEFKDILDNISVDIYDNYDDDVNNYNERNNVDIDDVISNISTSSRVRDFASNETSEYIELGLDAMIEGYDYNDHFPSISNFDYVDYDEWKAAEKRAEQAEEDAEKEWDRLYDQRLEDATELYNDAVDTLREVGFDNNYYITLTDTGDSIYVEYANRNEFEYKVRFSSHYNQRRGSGSLSRHDAEREDSYLLDNPADENFVYPDVDNGNPIGSLLTSEIEENPPLDDEYKV